MNKFSSCLIILKISTYYFHRTLYESFDYRANIAIYGRNWTYVYIACILMLTAK